VTANPSFVDSWLHLLLPRLLRVPGCRLGWLPLLGARGRVVRHCLALFSPNGRHAWLITARAPLWAYSSREAPLEHRVCHLN
jgi:hypothetical protein